MSKTRNTGFLTNVVQYNTQGDITFVSGSTTLLTISSSGEVITTGVISGSNALSSSYSVSSSQAENAALLDNLDSTSFVYTSSFNSYSSSVSVRVSNLESTASVLTSASASFAVVSSSYASASGSLSTRVTTLENTSASFATMSGSIASRVTKIEGNYATTGSNAFNGSQNITGSLTVSQAVIAQTLNVQQVTSSIVYSCGSNTFGCALTDVQQMTGSVRITGSLNTIGNACITSVCSPSFIGGTMSGTTVYASTAACSPIGCFATSCATSFLGGTMSGTTIYGSTAICGGTVSGTTATLTSTGRFSGVLFSDCRLMVGTNFSDQYYANLFIGGALTCGTNQYALLLDPQLSGTNNYGIFANARIKASTAVTNVYGVYAVNTEKLSGATITNNYGVYIENQTSGGTLNYALYSAGGPSYFAGCVGIGVTAPSYKLDVYRGSSGVVLNLQGVDAYDAETGILFSTSRAKISGFLNTTGGTPGTSLRFYTMPDGGSVTERMRITSDGIACFSSTVCAPLFRGAFSSAAQSSFSATSAGTNYDVTIPGNSRWLVSVSTNAVYHWNGILALTTFDSADFGVNILTCGSYQTAAAVSVVNSGGSLRFCFSQNVGTVILNYINIAG